MARFGSPPYFMPMNQHHSIHSGTQSPLYQQIATEIKQWIESGRLKAGDAVPSTRHMADLLGVARRTVMRGYELLISQGYLKPISGIGTVVSHGVSRELTASSLGHVLDSATRSDLRGVLSEYGRRLLQFEPGMQARLNSQGGPPSEMLPVRAWRQVLLRHFNDASQYTCDGPLDSFGYLPLREALANYLRRARAVKCTAEQVAVFSTSQHALDLIARLFLNVGDQVAVENPGFPAARLAFGSYGAEVRPVGVDQDGLLVDELRHIPTSIKLVHVTSYRQDPTGAVLSVTRRHTLLDWARSASALILEDDFDGDYRYGELLPNPLQSLDQDGRVLFLSTFWKTLFPISPLGVLVVPLDLIDIVRRAKNAVESLPPAVEQRALTDFLQEGWLERHILRAQRTYNRRRQALIYALTVLFKTDVIIAKRSAGMHFLVKFTTALPDEQLADCAATAGLSLASTRQYYVDHPQSSEFLVTFASLPEEAAYGCVQRFAELMKSLEPEFGCRWDAVENSLEGPVEISFKRVSSGRLVDCISGG